MKGMAASFVVVAGLLLQTASAAEPQESRDEGLARRFVQCALLQQYWPATGFADTWLRAMMLNEVGYEEAEVQPRVQARGGQAGAGARRVQRPGGSGLGDQLERGQPL